MGLTRRAGLSPKKCRVGQDIEPTSPHESHLQERTARMAGPLVCKKNALVYISYFLSRLLHERSKFLYDLKQ